MERRRHFEKQKEMRPHPGGYNRVERLTSGTCYCCLTHPIAKGNLRLCYSCYRDEWDADTRPDPNKITKEDTCELVLRVALMELTPPTPVKHFSCDDYSQDQLRNVLNGGTP
jgi:hypothetical protein